MALAGCGWVLPPLQASTSGAEQLWRDLGPGVVHLWRLCWSRARLPIDWLNDTERALAVQIRSSQRQREFCTCRAAWRAILARFYVPGGSVPAQLMLETTANGKPYIRNGHISWNASHTKDWAVLAVTSAGAAIGCDVERLDRQLRAPEALARRLGLTHSTDVVGVDESLSRRVLRAWSEREAVAKALGTGLGRMPNLSPISTAFQVVVVPVVAGQVLATVAWTPPRTVKRIEMFALETLTATEWARLALDQHAVMDMSSDPTSSAGIH